MREVVEAEADADEAIIEAIREEQDGQPEDEETTDENALEEAYAPEAEG